MKIDLHNKTLREAINHFIAEYNRVVSRGLKDDIEVIHGYGSSGVGGRIKNHFKSFSEAHKEYFLVVHNQNIGVTIVKPKKIIPVHNLILEKEILLYCSDAPKSLSKIQSKFFKNYEINQIKKTIKILLNKKLLMEIQKKEICYISK